MKKPVRPKTGRVVDQAIISIAGRQAVLMGRPNDSTNNDPMHPNGEVADRSDEGRMIRCSGIPRCNEPAGSGVSDD